MLSMLPCCYRRGRERYTLSHAPGNSAQMINKYVRSASTRDGGQPLQSDVLFMGVHPTSIFGNSTDESRQSCIDSWVGKVGSGTIWDRRMIPDN